jgi:hypothetical protein
LAGAGVGAGVGWAGAGSGAGGLASRPLLRENQDQMPQPAATPRPVPPKIIQRRFIVTVPVGSF